MKRLMIAIVMLLIMTGCNKNMEEHTGSYDDISTGELVVVDSTDIDIAGPSIVNTIHGDTVSDLKELKKNADLIVLGRVHEQINFSEYVTETVFEVDRAIKGKSKDTIVIREIGQIGDKDILQEEIEYILYLGDDYEGRYHIIGGEQGLIEIEPTSGEIKFRYATFRKEFDEEKMKRKNGPIVESELLLENFAQQ